MLRQSLDIWYVLCYTRALPFVAGGELRVDGLHPRSDKVTFAHSVVCRLFFVGDEPVQSNIEPRSNHTHTPFKNSYCTTPGCNNGVGRKRASYGHTVCKGCGEERARADRRSWTILQTYGKGAYQLVTPTAARAVLQNTNQKQPRGEFCA